MQLVGFSVKSGRSIETRISRTCVTIPSMILGIGSEPVGSIETCAVYGSICKAEADHDRAEVERADHRRVIDTTDNGSPWNGPER